MGKLTGKVAIITGAGSGMGRASAILFAREGARVAAADVTEPGLRETLAQIERDGGEAIALTVDVSKAVQVEKMVADTVKRWRQLDIIYNNAGLWRSVPTHEMTEEQWYQIINVDLSGVFFGCRYALPELMKRGGVILSTSSVAGILGVSQNAHYCAAKHGVIGFTKVVALDYAKYKVRAAAICPGAVVTNIGESMGISVDPAVTRQLGAALHPLGRACEPEDIANAALFLASDEASLISGVILTVDGAWTCGHTFPVPGQR